MNLLPPLLHPAALLICFFPLLTFGQSVRDTISDEKQMELDSLILHHSAQRDYEQALAYSDERLQHTESTYGSTSMPHLQSLVRKGDVYKKMGNYREALPYHEQQVELAGQLFGTEHEQYLLRLHNLAVLYYRTGEIAQAEAAYLRSLALSEQLSGKDSEEHARKMGDYVSLLTTMGQYEKATEMQREALAITERAAGKESIAYVKSLTKIVGIQWQSGDLTGALEGGIEALRITERVLGKDNPTYGVRLDNLAMIYERLGLYEEALPLSLEAIQNTEKHYGKEHPEYGISANNLALIYRRLGQYEKAIPLFEHSLKLTEQRDGKEHLRYGSRLDNLAGLYKDMGQYDRALPLSKEAVRIAINKVGKQHRTYTIRANNLANLYLRKKEFDTALSIYLETLPITEALVGKRHPEYGRRLHNIGLAYALKGDLDSATFYYSRSNENLLYQIQHYYPNLNEAERIQFVNNVFHLLYIHYSILPQLGEQHRDYVTELLNMRLVTKGLALNRSVEARLRSRSSEDEKLKEQFYEWMGLRRQMARLYLRSSASAVLLDSLKTRAGDLERNISRSALAAFPPSGHEVGFESIKLALKEDEAAVEFVQYRQFEEDDLSDTLVYLAILIRKEGNAPKVFRLGTGRQINPLLSAAVKINSAGSYITSPDIRKALYELVWQPLVPALQGIRRVYLSPAGELYKLSFAALGQAEDHYLSDDLEVRYLHTLRDVLQLDTLPQVEKDIALFGGAIYDQDSLDLIQLAETLVEKGGGQPLALNRSPGSDSTRYGIQFPYLPGTKKEVENLQALFSKKGWKTRLYEGQNAREENVKLLGSSSSPSVLHLATHGYFFQPYKGEAPHNTLRARIISAKNPLLRSGLALSGVNHAWKGGTPVEGLDDGILTAYEISNLDLSNTALVVLSACETGLGDIHNGEGVFGLQRAFKLAGVDRMLLSLWKVPDRETSELMQLFYEQFLEGLPVAKAFRKAQQTMKSKYPPFYWAGFVLIE